MARGAVFFVFGGNDGGREMALRDRMAGWSRIAQLNHIDITVFTYIIKNARG
jgi:hypothetical protein